ncbi:MAG: YdcH family protein [Rhodospirillales bacterium]|nr:YdcH family protein [Rhodospirillales bacterium]
MTSKDQKRELEASLAELRARHRSLDKEIGDLQAAADFDQLKLQRLKKDKLALKDEILRIEAILVPDIIA